MPKCIVKNGEFCLQLRDCVFDTNGKLISASVINGAWELEADDAAFWPVAFPYNKNKWSDGFEVVDG